MALRAASSGQNLSFPQNTDRCAGFLVCARKIVAGGNWRFNGMGDGRSAFTSTPGTDIFTANTNGYPTTNTAWNTSIANSWYNPNAWFRIQAMSGGSPTGLELIFQRSALTTGGNERLISISVYLSTNSVAGNATTPPSGGNGQLFLYAGANPFALSSTQSVINGNENIIFHAWDCDVPSGATGNVCTLAMHWHSGINTNKCGMIAIEALTGTDTADSYPILAMGGDWTATLGDAYASNYTTLASNSNITCFTPSSSTAWQKAVAPGMRNAIGQVLPAVNATAYAVDMDGYKPIYPVWIERYDGANAVFKGSCETIGRYTPGSSSDVFPLLMQDADGNKWLGGWFLLWPWPNITTNPTGYSLVTDTGHWKKRLFPATVDVTGPTIGTVSPGTGAISSTQSLSVSVTDAGTGVGRVIIKALYSSPVRHEIIFDGLSSVAGYDTEYDASGAVAAITNGYTYSGLVPDGGWRGPFSLTITAIDNKGNSSTSTTAYTMSASASPALSSLSPSAGAISATQNLSFRVADPTSLLASIVNIVLASGVRENVWNGAAFASGYSTSTRTPVVAGKSYDYVVTRTEGWPSAFDLEVIMFDSDANSVTSTTSYTMASSVSPALSSLSPSAGAISATQNLSFRVSDPTAMAVEQVNIVRSNGVRENVWNSVGFASGYSAGSTRTVISAGKTFDYVVARTEGWPSAFDLEVLMWDKDGNAVTSTTSYTMASSVNPAVSSLSPGASAISVSQSLSFRVSDPTALGLELVNIVLANGVRENVWNGSGLASGYTAGSSRTQIASGKTYDYVVARTAGWPSAFDLEVIMFDKDGNTVTSTTSYTMAATSSPTIASLSPVSGSSVPYNQVITFRTSDSVLLLRDEIWAVFADGSVELIWNGSAFTGEYDAGSTRTQVVAGKTYDYSIARDRGWHQNFTLVIYSLDGDNTPLTTSPTYTLSAANTATASLVTPAVGAISPTQTVAWRLTDLNQIDATYIWAVYSTDGRSELVWDGSAVQAPYSGSVATTSSTIRDISISRTPGWPDDVTLMWLVLDKDGIRSTGTLAYTITGSSAPTLVSVSPTNGSTVDSFDTLGATFTDDISLTRVVVRATFAEVTELVYDNGYQSPYTGTGSGTPRALSFTRTGGLLGDVTLEADLYDGDGHVTTVTWGYTVTGATPVVEFLDSPSVKLGSRQHSISFSVSDTRGLMIVALLFDGRVPEAIWLAGEYTYPYRDSNSVQTGDYYARTFTVRRASGWPSDVDLAIYSNGVRIA
jgi:hypothetical protein